MGNRGLSNEMTRCERVYLTEKIRIADGILHCLPFYHDLHRSFGQGSVAYEFIALKTLMLLLKRPTDDAKNQLIYLLTIRRCSQRRRD